MPAGPAYADLRASGCTLATGGSLPTKTRGNRYSSLMFDKAGVDIIVNLLYIDEVRLGQA